MKLEELLVKNKIEFKEIDGYLATYCLFCNSSRSGNLVLAFNIDKETWNGHCSICDRDYTWKEIARELDINPNEVFVEEKSQKEVKWNDKKISNKNKKSKAITRCFADIKSVPIDWLWKDRIAFGKLTMFVGDPNLGKSLITCDCATRVSKGFPFPLDNCNPPIGDVIFLSAEDDLADTIKPRLEAMEADCTRIHTIRAIQEENAEGELIECIFSLKRDIVALEELLINFSNCRLIIIDPISAYLDGTDSNKNSDIRGLLAPLTKLAEKFKVAIILISHLNKNSGENALYRTTGSLAFIATVRTAHIVIKDKNNPERILFMPLKNNISKVKTGLAYSIITAENGAPIIAWGDEPITITVDEALTLPESKEKRTATDEAVDFLRDLLADGSIKANEVIEQGKQVGINERVLRQACKKLNIKPKKIGFKPAYWVWGFSEDTQDAEDTYPQKDGIFSKPEDLGGVSTPKPEDSQDCEDTNC